MLMRIRGARIKRAFLSFQGGRAGQKQRSAGFPGNDALAGITDPPYVTDPNFFVRWLMHIKGDLVELACHPGYYDETLIGRDCTATDGRLERRVHELHLLSQPTYVEACRRGGFALARPEDFQHKPMPGAKHAA
jgi:hypothetical protein